MLLHWLDDEWSIISIRFDVTHSVLVFNQNKLLNSLLLRNSLIIPSLATEQNVTKLKKLLFIFTQLSLLPGFEYIIRLVKYKCKLLRVCVCYPVWLYMICRNLLFVGLWWMNNLPFLSSYHFCYRQHVLLSLTNNPSDLYWND